MELSPDTVWSLNAANVYRKWARLRLEGGKENLLVGSGRIWSDLVASGWIWSLEVLGGRFDLPWSALWSAKIGLVGPGRPWSEPHL